MNAWNCIYFVPIFLSYQQMRPRQYGRHFADAIFLIYSHENCFILIQITLWFIPKGSSWSRWYLTKFSYSSVTHISLARNIAPNYKCHRKGQWNLFTMIQHLLIRNFLGTKFLPLSISGSMLFHYSDVIMDTVASQITSLAIVYSIVYSGADQRKHQSSGPLAFVRGIHRDRWIPRTKGQ